MDCNLKRRATRNFTKLLQLLVSLAFFTALAPPLIWHALSWSGRPLAWTVPPVAAAMPLVCLFAVVQQARRIGRFISLRDAASIWRAATRRRLNSGRPITMREANAITLLTVLCCALLIFYLGPSHSWVVWQGRNVWPWLAAFGLLCLLLYPLAKKATADIASPRWFPAFAAASVALLPVVAVGMIADRRADARYFADGPVHRETVFARIEGPCLPHPKPWRRRLLCATAATSRGPIRHWPIRVERDAYDLQRRVGTICLPVPLEWAANGIVRVEGGARRYRAEELVPCPASLPRIARSSQIRFRT